MTVGEPCTDASTRWRCRVRSNVSSTVQRGVASRNGGSQTRSRKFGIERVARSTLATSRSQSGARSNHAMATTVECSVASFSMYQANASLSRMKPLIVLSLRPADIGRAG